MQLLTNDTFGPLVAYLLPGVTVLVGLRPWLPSVDSWFKTVSSDAPTIGGFLFLTIASLAAGMTVSAIRWVVLDAFHSKTGLQPKPFDFSKLGQNVEAMKLLIEIHYKHYLFYGNGFVAILLSWVSYRSALGWSELDITLDLFTAIILIVFFVTSRDTFHKYHDRLGRLLAPAR
jgi:hypothetical protein